MQSLPGMHGHFDKREMLMHRTLRFTVVLLVAMSAGCSSDGSTGIAGLSPPAALSAAVGVEPLLTGRVVLPIPAAAAGQLRIGVTIRNGLTESITSGSCAEQIDARAVNGQTWYDVTATNQVCILRGQLVRPGEDVVLTILADQAKLRLAAGGAGQTAVVRVRTIVAGANRSLAMTSADQQVLVP